VKIRLFNGLKVISLRGSVEILGDASFVIEANNVLHTGRVDVVSDLNEED
jgi:hypothetical protein